MRHHLLVALYLIEGNVVGANLPTFERPLEGQRFTLVIHQLKQDALVPIRFADLVIHYIGAKDILDAMEHVALAGVRDAREGIRALVKAH